MGSRKRSALRKQREAFVGLHESENPDSSGAPGGIDDVFAAEGRRRECASQQREAALRNKACESKNRYATRGEAQDAIASCAAWGRTGLHCYRCAYCKGWHLTSHPRNEGSAS